jgi:hypothetical protein
LKAQTESSIYTFNKSENPQNLIRSSNGDLYYTTEQQLKKLNSDGSVSTVTTLNNYPDKIAIDALDNIYYVNPLGVIILSKIN